MGGTIWRAVKGYEGEYEVSNTGRVRSRKTGHCQEMKLKYNRYTGYNYVILFRKGDSKTRSVHRLVAEVFVPNPNGYPAVNHKDEVKTNNNASNLEWCTQQYNNIYSKHKRYKKINVFTPEGELLATFESGVFLADFLGVSKGAVTNALKGKNTSCAGFVLKYAKEESQ